MSIPIVFKMNHFIFLLSAAILLVSQTGCKEDVVDPDNPTIPNALDIALEEAMHNASNGVGADFYKLATNLSDIPQDPNNPLTAAKVELGKMLYHETGLATSPKK